MNQNIYVNVEKDDLYAAIDIVRDEVIRKLRAILLSVGNVGLVRANEEFAKYLRGEVNMPFGKNEQHVSVRLIDFENPRNNSFILTNQFKIHELMSILYFPYI